jgi:two-component system cell cycle sensor histidine kinase/response regulator CckA
MSILLRHRLRSDGEILAALFNEGPLGLILLDQQGLIVKASAPLLASLGAAHGAALRACLPPAAAAALDRARPAQRGGSAPVAWTVSCGAKGHERTVTMTCLPLPSGRAVVHVADRTHELALEEKLAQSQRLQEVGQLAGGIAHDFNNLLTVILGGVDELLARPNTGDEAEDLRQIRAAAQRGAALVAQLLAFGRRQTLLPRVLALNDAIRRAAALLGRVLGEGIRLVLDLEEPGRLVRVDPTQLDQVLVNLAVNARDAMAGQGVLTIASGRRLLLKPEAIGGETVPPGRYATIEVRDTGAGIPPEVLPHILEPFFTTKRERGGTGLGLSTVHGIVSQSGGYLAVESRVGAGTCVRILLPRHEAAPWEPAPQAVPAPDMPGRHADAPPADAPAERGRVLLVEDEAPVRRLAERTLSRRGWQVIGAACAQDALDLMAAGEGADLACVVSDVVMPGMDGPTLVRTLRNIWPELPAILVSGYADAPLRAQLASEQVCFLSKPFAMADLANAVAALARAA